MDWFWRAGASGDWLGSVQVVENLADDDWVFDGGDALHGAAAGPAGLDVDIEYALQALSPVHGGAPILAFANRPLRALRRLLRCGIECRLSRSITAVGLRDENEHYRPPSDVRLRSLRLERLPGGTCAGW